MNKIKSYFLPLSLLLIVLTVFSCGGGGDDGPSLTPEEQRLVDLAGTSGVTWVATSVTFGGAPANGLENFSMTIRGNATSKTYTSTDGDPFFGASGTWDFNGNNINEVIFDGDNSNVYSISLNASATPPTLTMTVDYTRSGGVAAGVSGADGRYVFNLEKQ